MSDKQDCGPLKDAAPETIKEINEERKHLEGLLKDRINFHLLFAAVFMAGLSEVDNPFIRVGALIVITIVSAFMALAIHRTHQLVQLALKDLKKNQTTVYSRYSRCAGIQINANSILVWVPWMLSLSFAIAAGFYMTHASENTQDVRKGLVYHVEDHSDRRVVNDPGSPLQTIQQGRIQGGRKCNKKAGAGTQSNK